jgi:hypothetical protein
VDRWALVFISHGGVLYLLIYLCLHLSYAGYITKCRTHHYQRKRTAIPECLTCASPLSTRLDLYIHRTLCNLHHLCFSMPADRSHRQILNTSYQQRRRARACEEECAVWRQHNTGAHRAARHSVNNSSSVGTTFANWWDHLAFLNASSSITTINLRWNRRCKYCNIKVMSSFSLFWIISHCNSLSGAYW